MAFESLVLAAAVAAGPNPWQDSGHEVWRTVSTGVRDVGMCIRRHESINAGHYRAVNPERNTTAAGAYQMLTGFWQGNARWAKWKGKFVARGYSTADAAPPWIQDVVFVHSMKRGGIKAWRGTGCPGTG